MDRGFPYGRTGVGTFSWMFKMLMRRKVVARHEVGNCSEGSFPEGRWHTIPEGDLLERMKQRESVEMQVVI